MAYQSPIKNVLKKTLKAFEPPPRLSVTEWSDEYRVLSSEASAMAGKYYSSFAPYQKGIMDSLTDRKIKRTVLMCSAQVGKSEILLNMTGYIMSYNPSPLLVMLPTLSMAQAWSKERLAPMLRDTPVLRGKVKDPRSREANNTTLSKQYPGGFINIIASNSPSSISSRPVKVVLMDEVSRFGETAEGSSVELAIKRTTAFPNAKIVMVSTPTIKDHCQIETQYEMSNKSQYHIPCHHCNAMQTLDWSRVIYDEENLDAVHIACEHCGAMMEESKKTWMLKHGEWIAEHEDRQTAGFHINELYSPFRSWRETVEDYLNAKQNPEMMKVWVNTALGLPYEGEHEKIEAGDLEGKVERFDEKLIPERSLFMTAGIDTQMDRLEVSTMSWSVAENGETDECWVISHKIIWGLTSDRQVWRDLDEYLKTIFTTEDGRKLKIASACVDTGGSSTQSVYYYLRGKARKKIFGIKGSSEQGKPLVNKPTFIQRYNIPLYIIGVDTGKDWLYARVKADNLIHFSDSLDAEYFLQLASEKKKVIMRNGRQTFRYVKTRKRNETLDCFLYSMCAKEILNPNYEILLKRKNNPIISDDDDTPKQPIRRPRFKKKFI